jgi:hypothetical protein
LRQLFKGWNSAEWKSGEFSAIEEEMRVSMKAHARAKERLHA